jgi:hypothetical protein
MAEETPLLTDFVSSVISYEGLMEELKNWVHGNDVLRLDMNLGSHFTSNLQYAAGSKYGVLAVFFAKLKDSGELGDYYTRSNVKDALTALIDDMEATKNEVKEEMERLDCAFGFWSQQIRDIRDSLKDICDNRRKAVARSLSRRSSPRPAADEEPDDGSDNAASGDRDRDNEGGSHAEEDLDLCSTLRDIKRRRKAEDVDGDDGEEA